MKKRATRATNKIIPDDDWRARDALNCLERAQEIQADAKLMKQVKEHIREKRTTHSRLLRLKDRAI